MSKTSKQAADRDFYVDDLITSVFDVSSAQLLVEEVSKTLQKGGFRLRKWISNVKDVLMRIPSADLSEGVLELQDFSLPTERTLGVEWDADSDELKFKFECREEEEVTRRKVLSIVSMIFDPLGLVSPLILSAKIILQDVCRKGFGWDETLNGDEREGWLKWKEMMNGIKYVAIPRCVLSRADPNASYQLHIFSDASEKGYGTAAYVRSASRGARVVCNLLMAKSRVAPLKTITIPRLELSAAVLAVRLYRCITKELDFRFSDVFFWTDSMIVLRYLNNTTTRFCTFVANRVQEIHDSTRPRQWKHVDSKRNPADLASRGMYWTKEGRKLWLEGPDFLKLDESCWPLENLPLNDIEGLELKSRVTINRIICVPGPTTILLESYSSWSKMKTAVAWYSRFHDYLRLMSGDARGSLKLGIITSNELMKAEHKILVYVQKTCFPEEYRMLSISEGNVRNPDWNKSTLVRLSPIMIDGLIRVKGRLQFSNWSEDSKHPVILPKSHHVTRVIVNLYHRMEGHSGTAHVLAATRRKYWILQGGTVVKKILGECITCKRQNAVTVSQQMAPLPAARIDQGWYPFQHVGVDYFGPLSVKHGRVSEKRYGCLFSCLQCRAIHLEVANSLSTDSFIMALLRFVNRRGNPKDLYSDNGSNFVGTDRELKNWINSLRHKAIISKLSERSIQWHFNPPMASHRGGSWERMIRSVRRVLVSTLRGHSVDDETLTTYMSQAERIVNNRPITTVYTDVNEPTPLRPNDLIQPRSADAILIDAPLEIIAKKRWKVVNNLTATFWKRWRNEYLPLLQVRNKWVSPHRNLQAGDVVNVMTDSTPKGLWPLGIVQKVYHGNDGLVRTVELRTAGGIIKRDIRKVCLLEGIG